MSVEQKNLKSKKTDMHRSNSKQFGGNHVVKTGERKGKNHRQFLHRFLRQKKNNKSDYSKTMVVFVPWSYHGILGFGKYHNRLCSMIQILYETLFMAKVSHLLHRRTGRCAILPIIIAFSYKSFIAEMYYTIAKESTSSVLIKRRFVYWRIIFFI